LIANSVRSQSGEADREEPMRGNLLTAGRGGATSAPDAPLPPKVERYGNITVITFTHDAIRDVENVIAQELEVLPVETGVQHLLLDFTNVKRLNSVELGTLITLHKRVRAAGGRLTLFNLSADVFSLFTITRLDTLLGICREGAVAGSALPPPRAC
jgi:anti-sigma B factor antagonist